jgi:RNA polymerase sigma factor (sigma-70 family)
VPLPDVTTEATLVAQAREGDERAFAELVSPCRRVLFAVCMRICGNEADALDATQDALVAAWRHLDRFDGRSRFSTWLYRIAHNAALMQVRRRRDLPGLPDGPESAVPDPSADVDTVLTVRWALERLPPDFRAALVLREYAELSYAEIADIQGIPENTVRSRIARARQAMVRLLAETPSGGGGAHQ